ncbi:prepilin peptidase [Alkalibacillus sp. S2W]|uniref:prepilin peptidase n=1 Tax=Alkalibacillus TaxID=331654 RepID=UPI00141DAA1D|nr:leader peptidase (prepilin peptidase)/N-methyltransferase [Alkalibacillus almallahensis]
MIWITLYIFVLGLVLGSFYNVVGMRVADGESIVTPRSHCPRCGHVLKSYELIPVLSYLFQKGQCRQCGVKISPVYPFFEVLTGGLFVYAFFHIGFHIELFLAWLLISLLIIITISDWYKQLIPDRVLIAFAIIILAWRIWMPTEPWYDSYLAALLGFGLLLLIAIVSRGGMGGGDIKLFAVLGLFLGVQKTLLTLMLASVIGTVIGLVLMGLGRVKKGKPIPFGPFIASGALVAYFYGDPLINWYLSLML